MANCIMIQGTGSNVGKSVMAAGLCRIFRQAGLRVAPFKAQNMALNSYITDDGYELGRAQAMQAECAKIAPDVRFNPVLLKPTSDQGSQVIVNGSPIGTMRATEYYAHKTMLLDQVLAAYNSLAAEYDVIVIEGAGSPAEINLRANDIVNMGLASRIGAPVLLVGDIDRGGVFASLYGTIALIDRPDRDLIKGVIINKFRGDPTLLKPGLQQFEQLTQVPVLGVVPQFQLILDDEDSLSTRLTHKQAAKAIDIAVICLPKLSNFTDFNALELLPDVSVRYVTDCYDLGQPDLIIVPGSKSVMSDLLWLRQTGLAAAIRRHAANNRPVFGICGGYQMLGMVIKDPDGAEQHGDMEGLGLLAATTTFYHKKVRTQVSGHFGQVNGVLSGLSLQPFSGYEIHMGKTDTTEQTLVFCQTGEEEIAGGSQAANIYGCYVHGIFDSAAVCRGLLSSLHKMKGLEAPTALELVDLNTHKEQEYDRLAEHLRQSLDLAAIYKICGVNK